MRTYPNAASFAPWQSGPTSVRRARLWFGLMAAPASWMLDDMLSYYIASWECRTKSTGSAPFDTGSPWLWIVLIAGLIVALAGTWIAIGNWRKTRGERPDGGRTEPWQDDGHTRFIAAASVLTGIGFLAAFVFMVFNVALAPICGL